MQPYFLPYIGYFQLIQAADRFVVYDNIQYTKKGWINRNRILQNGKDEYISLPLKKDSDYLDVVQRSLADNFEQERDSALRKIKGLYHKAPQFQQVYPLLERIYDCPDHNLFRFIFHSIREVCAYLDIRTEMLVSSSLPIDHNLRSEDKVIAICKATHADAYLNPIGGTELYQPDRFRLHGFDLQFIKSTLVEYPQFGKPFVPWLSILDVMMFNSVEHIQQQLDTAYHIVRLPFRNPSLSFKESSGLQRLQVASL
ncbi:MAG TPA: WbqC family protein [Saprospiraceae bacterium]|nr:WbqC family protein [Saprospiraceae bacterium]